MRAYRTPEPVNVDAYQAGHFELVPPGMNDFQVSQGIFRKPLSFEGSPTPDHRLIAAGLRFYIENHLCVPMHRQDVIDSTEFYSTFHAHNQPPYCKPYPFPANIFERVVRDYDGYLPIVIQALRDGQAHYVGEPHIQVFCEEPGMGELVGYIESSLLPYLWTSSIVATRGRIRKDSFIRVYKQCYPHASNDELEEMVRYKFHDFGRRGAASALITGVAHFMNWLGSDTCDAAYVAQMYMNGRKSFGACSVMAAAHRTVTTWPTENDSVSNAIEKFGSGILSFVADSYDYEACMKNLASHAKYIQVKGGFLVGRPDSGDIVETILTGLKIFEDGFGVDKKASAKTNGYKVLNNCGILQGDGVSDQVLFEKIFPAVINAGYSPINLAIGMGEHNHKCVRSETEIGYKTCAVATGDLKYQDWRMLEPGYVQVMKGSKNLWKRSVPTPVRNDFSGVTKGDYHNRVSPVSIKDLREGNTGDLVVHYDGRKGVANRTPAFEVHHFDRMRERTWQSWQELPSVSPYDTFSSEIRTMQEQYMRNILEK